MDGAGYYEYIVAKRASIIAANSPAVRARILGRAPQYATAKIHAITIDLRTGKRSVESNVAAEKPVAPLQVHKTRRKIEPTLPGEFGVIVQCVASAFGIKADTMFFPGRAWLEAHARFACWWLLWRHYGWTKSGIARAFKRDHSSVMAGIRQAHRFMKNDPAWREKYLHAELLVLG